MSFLSKTLCGLSILLWASVGVSMEASEDEARAYVESLEIPYSTACNTHVKAVWDYETNVTPETEKLSAAAATEFQGFKAKIQREVLANYSNYKEFKDPQLSRVFKDLAESGPGTMDMKDVKKMIDHQSVMETAFATATVCDFKNPSKCDLRYDPDIEQKLAEVRDWEELAHYWTKWHDTMSKAIPPSMYTQYLKYKSQQAIAKGYSDIAKVWLRGYDDESPVWTADNFKSEMLSTWTQLQPYYDKLAAYVRMKLRKLPEYSGRIGQFDLLPAHLLGNMWAQEWTALHNRTKPFQDSPSLDVTAAMRKANFTVERIFRESDTFFQGLGLFPMTDTFWEKSMIERPSDGREVVCHASAFDFCLGKNSTDFRIKQCTKVDMYNLVTVHHEMGHIQYYMQFSNEPFVFRGAANPGFNEAIGDALALAVITPKHLQCVLKLDLGQDIDCFTTNTADGFKVGVTGNDINFLYMSALKKFVVFPWAISVDSWRWEAFEGKLNESTYNSRWWEIRRRNQRIVPPSDRSSPELFDPASKFHIAASIPYLRYFVAHILQFQFYEAMCIAAGEYSPNSSTTKPLYQCDFSGSKAAGKVLSGMMRLGSTEGWRVALKAITGSPEMSILPVLNYFKPLFVHIEAELDQNGENVCFVGDACAESVAK